MMKLDIPDIDFALDNTYPYLIQKLDGDDPTQEQIEEELKKWVKRSTVGSIISTALILSWILVFQFNKENFGANWFVYSPADEILTGW